MMKPNFFYEKITHDPQGDARDARLIRCQVFGDCDVARKFSGDSADVFSVFSGTFCHKRNVRRHHLTDARPGREFAQVFRREVMLCEMLQHLAQRLIRHVRVLAAYAIEDNIGVDQLTHQKVSARCQFFERPTGSSIACEYHRPIGCVEPVRQ